MMRRIPVLPPRIKTVALVLFRVFAGYCILQTVVAYAWNISRFNSYSDVLGYVVAMMEDTTAYADTYSEAGFRQVRTSMTVEEVRHILGEPLQKQAVNDGEWWRYTKGYPDMNYWMRIVKFDTRSRVQGKIGEYWVD